MRLASGQHLQLFRLSRCPLPQKLGLLPGRGFGRTPRFMKWPLQIRVCEILQSYSYLGGPCWLTCGPVNPSLSITGMRLSLVSTFLIPLKCSVISLESFELGNGASNCASCRWGRAHRPGEKNTSLLSPLPSGPLLHRVTRSQVGTPVRRAPGRLSRHPGLVTTTHQTLSSKVWQVSSFGKSPLIL